MYIIIYYIYFRVHPALWNDRLSRMKFMGLNTVQVYVPWNFHEENEGEFNFKDWRDLPLFIKIAQDNDLLVMLRAGPYMCGEWEFGGFPAWLLNIQPTIKIRTYEEGYISKVTNWWNVLLPKMKPLLEENGGPIIGISPKSFSICLSTF